MTCLKRLDSGWCSFCGNDLFRLLFSAPRQGAAICDRCTLSSCDALAALLGAGGSRGYTIPPYYDSEFPRRIDELLDSLEASGRRSGPLDGVCSFCDAAGGRLIAGLKASICDRCIGRCAVAVAVPSGALDDCLVTAFPPVVIDRAMIEESTAVWDAYLETEELAWFEGTHWRQLPSTLLYRHATLLGCAGDSLFRSLLPAFLRYLLHEHHELNDMPWHVATQLAKRDAKFDRRVELLTPAQREAIRTVLAHLATVRRIDEVMMRAYTAWN